MDTYFQNSLECLSIEQFFCCRSLTVLVSVPKKSPPVLVREGKNREVRVCGGVAIDTDGRLFYSGTIRMVVSNYGFYSKFLGPCSSRRNCSELWRGDGGVNPMWKLTNEGKREAFETVGEWCSCR